MNRVTHVCRGSAITIRLVAARGWRAVLAHCGGAQPPGASCQSKGVLKAVLIAVLQLFQHPLLVYVYVYGNLE